MTLSIANKSRKKAVVFVMGATGTGKSKLSVDLACHFVPSEIINSDKIQVYKGLDIVTNRITKEESRGVKHHLLGEFDPDSDFSSYDFCLHAHKAIEAITRSGKLPIVVGGSNNYIEALVEEHFFEFKNKYDSCFIWLDVSLPVAYATVSKRVDRMIEAGLVDEVREVFVPGANSSQGIRRAIGVPELDKYFMVESTEVPDEVKEGLFQSAITEIKSNTCDLVDNQTMKIRRLRGEMGWEIHRVDATRVHESSGEESEKAWEELVLKPSLKMVADFFNKK